VLRASPVLYGLVPLLTFFIDDFIDNLFCFFITDDFRFELKRANSRA